VKNAGGLLTICTGEVRAFFVAHPTTMRSYGFYRYLGWKSTGTFDANHDEVLELLLGAPSTESELFID
jgi:hypothetical protein